MSEASTRGQSNDQDDRSIATPRDQLLRPHREQTISLRNLTRDLLSKRRCTRSLRQHGTKSITVTRDHEMAERPNDQSKSRETKGSTVVEVAATRERRRLEAIEDRGEDNNEVPRERTKRPTTEPGRGMRLQRREMPRHTKTHQGHHKDKRSRNNKATKGRETKDITVVEVAAT